MDKEQRPSVKKRNLRLVEKYDNDDYSRFAAPDYSEHPFEIGEPDSFSSDHERHIWNSGISGGTQQRSREENFYGKGPKGYKRTDEKIYEDVCELLMRHRDIDARDIAVNVKHGVVTLSGKVRSRRMKRLSELSLEDLSGVNEVVNDLTIFHEKDPSGPESVTKKDLGIT